MSTITSHKANIPFCINSDILCLTSVPPKQHYDLISRIQLDWHINIGTIAMEWWDQPIGVSLDFGLSIINLHDIGGRSFSIPLWSVSGLTLQCFVVYLFLLLLPWETQHYLYSLPQYIFCTSLWFNKNNFPHSSELRKHQTRLVLSQTLYLDIDIAIFIVASRQ